MRLLVSLVLIIVGYNTSIAQELVVNGGAELPLSVGWTQLNPAEAWKIDAQRPPHSGSYHFYPENTVLASSELYQDINISGNAVSIDAGTASYTFSGWRRGYKNVSPFSNDMDRSQIIVEYRDASGNVLASYDTGSAVFTSWTNNTDTRNAPVGTRTVRIRLISVRVSGSDNDGYYDDISFKQNCTAPTSVLLTPGAAKSYCAGSTISISGVASPANANYYYTWYKDGNPITTPSKTYTDFTATSITTAYTGIYTLHVEDGNTGTAGCYLEASVTITVDLLPLAGTISAAQEICLGSPAAPLTGTPSTGGTAVKNYKWQVSTFSAAGPWTTIQPYNTTATGYAPTLPARTEFFQRMDSSGACAAVPTNSIKILVNNPFMPKPITSLLRDTLCVGENFQLTSQAPLPTPVSYNGGYYYYWRRVQQGISNTIFLAPAMAPYPDAPKAAAVSDSGTYYFVVQDGAGTRLCRDSVKIVIRINKAPTTKGLIQSNQQICLLSPASVLTQRTAPTGYTGGPLYYHWYTTTDTTGVPVLTKLTPAGTASSYAPGTPVASYYFVRKDSIHYCAALATNFVQIRVNNAYMPKPITSLVRDTLCTGENFQLTGHMPLPAATSLNGGFYYSWRKVQQGITNTVVVAPASALTPYPASVKAAAVSDSGTYYLIVQDGPGATLCKDSVKIVIRINKAPTTRGLIQSNQQICLLSPAPVLTERTAASGYTGGPLYYHWYTTADTSNVPVLTKLTPAGTASSYAPGTPVASRYFVRKDSIHYCVALATNFVQVRVNNTPKMDSVRATVNDTLCANLGDQFQLKGYIDSLTAGKASLNGGYYFTWKQSQAPINTPVTVGTPGKYQDYPALSRTVVEGDSGTYQLIVQDGAGATTCIASLTIHMVVSKTCIPSTCAQPTFVSIKTAATNVCSGSSFTLQKNVLSFPATPPSFGYTYTWLRSNTLGTVVVQGPSASYQDLVIAAATAADSGRYQLRVQDGSTTPASCGLSSAPISIVVNTTTNPTVTLSSGLTCQSANLLVTATASTAGTTPTYAWQKAGSAAGPWSAISGASNATYPIINPQPADSGTVYQVLVTSSDLCNTGPASNTVVLQVQSPVQPTVAVSANPSGLICDTLQHITYTATPIQGAGTAPTYQWYNGATNTIIPGATNRQYTPAAKPVNGDQVYVRMGTNLSCATAATSNLAAYTVRLLPKPAPIISTADTSICTYDNISLTTNNTAATGSAFQWYKNDTPLSGATNTSYTVSSADFPGGVYTFEESTSACASMASNTTNVRVLAPPVVSAGSDFFASKNTIVTLQGSVSGATGYSWKPATNLTDPNLLHPDARILNTITYTLFAADATGLCTAQSSVTVTMQDAVTIPNVVTPNGDGLNDTWEIEHIQDYPSASCIIYNRWGNIVWKNTNTVVQWNGTNYRNGELLPDGTYFYIVDLKSPVYSEPYTGYIQIVR